MGPKSLDQPGEPSGAKCVAQGHQTRPDQTRQLTVLFPVANIFVLPGIDLSGTR